MAKRQKEDRWVGIASHGMVRRWGRFSSRVCHRVVPDRERAPDRCPSSGSTVDACHGTPTRARRAERGRMAVLWTCCEPSLVGRHVRRAFLRHAWLDCTPIILATACHQRHDVETYRKSKPQSAGTRPARPCPPACERALTG